MDKRWGYEIRIIDKNAIGRRDIPTADFLYLRRSMSKKILLKIIVKNVFVITFIILN